jgi:hypothetical protein
VFGYLRGTKDRGVIFGADKSLHYYGTSDAAHLTQQATHDPLAATLGVTGYHFQLAGGSTSWRASTQNLTSHSSTESKLYALDEAAREMVCLNKLLVDFGIPVPEPVVIGQDNMAAITLTNSENFNPRTKHNDLQREGVCRVRYLPADNIPSDVLTKALGARDHHKHSSVLLGYTPPTRRPSKQLPTPQKASPLHMTKAHSLHASSGRLTESVPLVGVRCWVK